MSNITFVADSLTVPASASTKIVDLAQEAGASIPFGCQNGICGTCIVKIRKGKEFLNKPSEKERNTLELFGATNEHRLTCQCVLERDGDVEIDEA